MSCLSNIVNPIFLHLCTSNTLIQTGWQQTCSCPVLQQQQQQQKPKNLKQFFTPAQFVRLRVCAVAWKTSSLWPPLWLCFFSKELRWKAYLVWQRTSCSLYSLQHLWAHSALPYWHRWHEACPYFLTPDIQRLWQWFPHSSSLIQACIHACMSAYCRLCVSVWLCVCVCMFEWGSSDRNSLNFWCRPVNLSQFWDRSVSY